MQKNNVQQIQLRENKLKKLSLSYYVNVQDTDIALLFLSPTLNPIKYFHQLKSICIDRNYTLVVPTQIGNTQDTELCIDNVLNVVKDVKDRFNVKKIYISGLSGGGRTAAIIGCTWPNLFQRIITICGTHPITPFMNTKDIIDSKVTIHTVTGSKDKLRKECKFLHEYCFNILPNVTSYHEIQNLGHEIPNDVDLNKLFNEIENF